MNRVAGAILLMTGTAGLFAFASSLRMDNLGGMLLFLLCLAQVGVGGSLVLNGDDTALVTLRAAFAPPDDEPADSDPKKPSA